ncbi:MAG TPA: hypothetical protein DEB31_03755 [Clostridiales bacterium]|nr:hypothetical protein [Clostridiales bacterium]
MRRFIQNAWVFFVAAAAIIVSTVLLSVSTTMAQNQVNGVVAALPAEPISLGLSSAPPAASQDAQEDRAADTFVMPRLLHIYNQYDRMPEAYDITSAQAVEIAARKVAGVFGADLDGEVCNIYFYSVGEAANSRGQWQIRFGGEVPVSGSYTYTATIDSISAEVLNLSQRMNMAKTLFTEEPISQEEYEAELKESTARAEELAKLFAPDSDIRSVEPDTSYIPYPETEQPYYSNLTYHTVTVVFTDDSSLLFNFLPASDETTINYTPGAGGEAVATEAPAMEVTAEGFAPAAENAGMLE